MKKRVLSILLTVIMLIGIMPLSVFAAVENIISLSIDGETTYYSDVGSALNAMQVSDGKEIILKISEENKKSDFTLSNNSTTGLSTNINTNNFHFDTLSVPPKANVTIVNSTNTININTPINNEGVLVLSGNLNIVVEVYNKGGILTLEGEGVRVWNANGITNSDGGTVNVDGANIHGDTNGSYNEENCTINIINGGSIDSDYTGIRNYGTIYADDFSFYAYGTPINNIGGKVALKNGEVYATYGPGILSNGGEVYVENCEISCNQSGSGISTSGTLHIKDSTVISSQFGLTGVSHAGTLIVENSTIDGGYDGLHLSKGTAKISNSYISGGFYSYAGYGISNNGEMTVENCRVNGGYGVGNSGTIHLKGTDINDLQWGAYETYAITNSGNLYFEQGIIKGGFSAYIDQGGYAEFKNATISGFDFTWNYDPVDLYGKESTFYMNDGTVKLYDTTLPHGFYVVTDKESATQHVVKDLIAPGYTLFTNDGTPVALSDTDTMLDGEYYTAQDFPDFTKTIAHLNEYNITSADREKVEAVLAEIEKYNSDNLSEENTEKIRAATEKCNILLDIIEAVKLSIDSVTSDAEKADSATSDTNAVADAEKSITQAVSLLAGNNLTQSERETVESAKSKLEKYVNELEQREKAINDTLNKFNSTDVDNLTTDDTDTVNKLIADIDNLLKEKLTDSQRKALEEAKSTLEKMVDELRQREKAINDTFNKFNSTDVDNLTTDDTDTFNELIADIDNLLEENLTDSQRKALEEAKSTLEKMVDELRQREKAINDTLNKFNSKDVNNLTTGDNDAIDELIAGIDKLLEENLTESQTNTLQEAKEKLTNRLEELAEVSDELNRIQTEFEQINRKRINIFDLGTLEALKAEIDGLIAQGTLGGSELAQATRLSDNVQNLIELVGQPYFYGIIRIFWTVVSMIKSIIN